jgi:hypothetical protein
MALDIKESDIGEVESVDQTTNNLFLRRYRVYARGYFIFLVACLLLSYFSTVFFMIGFVSAIAVALCYAIVHIKVRNTFMQQFGASLGLAYAVKGEVGSGTLFSTGHDQQVYDVLTGVYNGRNVRIYFYQYTIGQGKSSYTYTATVFEVTFDSVMPDLLLLRRPDLFGLALEAKNSTSLHLEGDFNTYFSVSVARDREQEAYQILTPDVMTHLIDDASKLNFEFNQNKVYIFTRGLIMVRAELQKMFDLAEYLDAILSHNVSEIHAS